MFHRPGASSVPLSPIFDTSSSDGSGWSAGQSSEPTTPAPAYPMGLRVVSSGIIGAGKSTFQRRAPALTASALDMALERVEEHAESVKLWQAFPTVALDCIKPGAILPPVAPAGAHNTGTDFLGDFYGAVVASEFQGGTVECDLNSLQLQMLTIMSRIGQQPVSGDVDVSYAERDDEDDAFFAAEALDSGFMSLKSHTLYTYFKRVFVTRLMPVRALKVYLRCSPETAWNRCQERARDGESDGVPLEYLQRLYVRHEAAYMNKDGTPRAGVVVLDAEAPFKTMDDEALRVWAAPLIDALWALREDRAATQPMPAVFARKPAATFEADAADFLASIS